MKYVISLFFTVLLALSFTASAGSGVYSCPAAPEGVPPAFVVDQLMPGCTELPDAPEIVFQNTGESISITDLLEMVTNADFNERMWNNRNGATSRGHKPTGFINGCLWYCLRGGGSNICYPYYCR